MMRALITGGAGYIGSHLVHRWIELGGEALVMDDLSTGHPEAVANSAELLVADLRTPGKWMQTVRHWHPEVVFHFAARSIVSESCRWPWRYLADNTAMTLHVLQCTPHEALFVYSSSCSVYGDTQEGAIAEDAPLAPTSAYAESKAIGERLVHAWCIEHGARGVALRYFNVVGCACAQLRERHEPETHLVPNILHAAFTDTPFYLYGTNHPTPDGTAIRDFVDVRDLVDAHIIAAQRLQKEGRKPFFDAFNLGKGKGMSVRQVIHIAERITGKQIDVRQAPPRPGDAPMLVAATDKWHRWTNTDWQWRSLEESIRSVWDAMQ